MKKGKFKKGDEVEVKQNGGKDYHRFSHRSYDSECLEGSVGVIKSGPHTYDRPGTEYYAVNWKEHPAGFHRKDNGSNIDADCLQPYNPEPTEKEMAEVYASFGITPEEGA